MRPHIWHRWGSWCCAEVLWFGRTTLDGCGIWSRIGTGNTPNEAYRRYKALVQ